jgi:hypothetical protein
MANKAAKIIRVATVVPVIALALLLILYFARPDIFNGPLRFALSIVFLVGLPLLAYPLQPVVPKFKDMGREGQRSLAMVAANLGYIAGIVFALFSDSSRDLLIIYLTYFLSGLLIVLFNKVLKLRASGHACGIVGPLVSLVYFCGPVALWGVIVLAAAWWASVTMKRHTHTELILGSILPVAALGISIVMTQPI